MNISLVFLIQIIITMLFCLMATIFDIRKNIVPDILTFGLLLFGIVSNLILSLLTSNIKYILASIISACVTYAITYLMWQLNIWGGGDVKLFTGIASVIPLGINIDFLNIFPELSLYPFSFSVVINSILVSFPFLLIFFIYLIYKNNFFKRNVDLLVNIFNVSSQKYLIEATMNRLVPVRDIKEGNIINNYYFSSEHVRSLIDEIDGNLRIYKSDDDNFRYYFKSQSAGGITKKEMYLLKIMNAQGFITKDISIKVAFPFTPSILLGLMIAIFYGDILMLFTKNMFLVF